MNEKKIASDNKCERRITGEIAKWSLPKILSSKKKWQNKSYRKWTRAYILLPTFFDTTFAWKEAFFPFEFYFFSLLQFIFFWKILYFLNLHLIIQLKEPNNLHCFLCYICLYFCLSLPNIDNWLHSRRPRTLSSLLSDAYYLMLCMQSAH